MLSWHKLGMSIKNILIINILAKSFLVAWIWVVVSALGYSAIDPECLWCSRGSSSQIKLLNPCFTPADGRQIYIICRVGLQGLNCATFGEKMWGPSTGGQCQNKIKWECLEKIYSCLLLKCHYGKDWDLEIAISSVSSLPARILYCHQGIGKA